jgi:CubicO group peptidase (beta-lactamase class C family)
MIDWLECPPERAGIDPTRLAHAVELVAERGATAQLCVLRAGKLILDRCYGCGPDALFWIFSASKPFLALAVHLLAERRQLSLDDPVAHYWPAFAQWGKQAITIRHVLAHRAGIPHARGMLRDGAAITSWQRSIRLLERARPSWPAGQVPAYHAVSYGFVLGEVVRRVTGAPVEEFLATELLRPWGLSDTYLGLPPGARSRSVPIRGCDLTHHTAAFFANRPALRQAVIPAAGISTTARDLACFYQALLSGGEGNGVRVLRPSTIAQAHEPSSDGEVDRVAGLPIRWSYGFQLGGPTPDSTRWRRPIGELSSRATFGHNGSNTCLGWADPTRQLVVAYLTNLLTPRDDGAPHLSAVSDALLSACR